MSGLILTISLFVGISLYVSNTSKIVLQEIYSDEGRIDVIVNTGLVDPYEHAAQIDDYINDSTIVTIDEVVGFTSWSITALNWDWYTNGSGVLYNGPNQGLTPTVSVKDGFYDFFESLIIMKEGEWNLTSIPNGAPDNSTLHNVVVSEKFLNKSTLVDSQKKVGGKFFTWNWLAVKNPYVNQSELFEQKELNEKGYCRIAGIVDSNSSIFHLESVSSILYSSGFFSSEDLKPSFFDRIVFKWGEGGYIKAVDFYNLMKFNEDSLNKDRPLTTLEYLEDDVFTLRGYLVVNNNNETYARYEDSIQSNYYSIDSGIIKDLIKEYSYWLNAALPKFLMFSSPVIFLGIYVLNFTIGHTMKERGKEISSLKSRGFANKQIWFMLIFENTLTATIGAFIGVFFGEILSGVLESELTFNIIVTRFEAYLNHFPVIDFLIAFMIGWLLLLAISFLPTARIMGLSIDVMARHETNDPSEAAEKKQFRYNLQLIGISLFFVIGLPTIGISALDNSFMTALGIIVLAISLIGGVTFMSQVARLIPYQIDKFLNSRYAQLFVISREMRRLTKRSSAAFVVLSLTMAFGIISSGLVATSTSYYSSDAQFKLGSDASVGIKDTVWRSTSGYTTASSLANNSLYPEVESVSYHYSDVAYLLTEDELMPEGIYEDRNIYIATHRDIELVFIDAMSFKETAYFKDFFSSSSINSMLETMAENPNTTCILDSNTAKELSVGKNDPVRFTSGFLYPDTVFQGDTTLLGTVKYFPPLFKSSEKSFVIVDYQMIDYQNRRFTETEFKGFTVSRPVSNIIVRFTDEYKQNDVNWGENFVIRVTSDITNVYGLSVENTFTIQTMLSSSNREFTTLLNLAQLDFYYALIVSAVGFLLVLEIKTVEKKTEIGALKAIGFGNRETFNLILAEGVISIIAASTAGLIIGAFCAQIMNFMLLPILSIPKVFVLDMDMLILQLTLGFAGAIFGVIIPAFLTRRFTISELIKSD